MRVLITGGAGFFGSRAAMHFKDADVHLVDRIGQSWARVDALGVKATRHESNLLDSDSRYALVGKVRPDIIVHLAWCATPGIYLTSDENFAHVDAALSLFMVARDLGCARFCGAGTCLEYDTSIGILREDSPARPESVYAASKLATFTILERATKQSGMSFAWMRFFYPYGPHEATGRLVSSTIFDLLAGRPTRTTPGEQLKDFIHVDDVGRAIVTVALSRVEGIVNVGAGTSARVRDVVTELASALGRENLVELGAMPYRAGDPMRVEADTTKLRALGFETRYGLKEGLRDTIAWARERASRS